MAKKKKGKKEPHPTIFVLEGSIRWFKEGSMLELHMQVRPEEWKIIVDETVRYKIFVECLKTVACPILEDSWTEEDEWFLFQLGISVSRMRNIDPLLVASIRQDAIKEEYTKLMKENAGLAKKEINNILETQSKLFQQLMHKNGKDTRVSDL